MDWLASEDGYKAAVEVEKARKRLLATVQSGEAIKETITTTRVKRTAVRDAAKLQRNREFQLQSDFLTLWLRATCEQLYYTHPQELRDMIYEYLNADVKVCDGYRPQSGDPGGIGWELCYGSRLWRIRHMTENFLGCNTFRELMENFYREPVMSDDLIIEGDMQDFLTRDKWGLGIRPADHIRVLRLKVSEYDVDHSVLLSSIISLSQLKQGAHVFLTLTPTRWLDSPVHNDHCRRFSDDFDELSFYVRPHDSIYQFFRDLRPICRALYNLTNNNIKLTVIFETVDLDEKDVSIIFHEPHGAIELSETAWMKMTMKRRKEHIKNELVCECRRDESSDEGSEDNDEESETTEEEIEDTDSESEEIDEKDEVNNQEDELDNDGNDFEDG